jgi:hypothetical protein
MEERGFDSVWGAEHSHIPVPRRTRADSELGKRYYDVMDPFVTLTAAACHADMVRAIAGTCRVKFLSGLAGSQGKDALAEARCAGFASC